MKSRRAGAVALAGLLTTALLSACASPAPVSAIQTTVNSQLKSQESGATATVDFSAIPGDWDRLLIVCRQATREQIDQALGFHWSKAPDPSDVNFLSMIVLVKSRHVTTWFQAGLDQDQDLVTHWYFSPCPMDGSYRQASIPVLTKPDTKVEFQQMKQGKVSWWVVTPEELAALDPANH